MAKALDGTALYTYFRRLGFPRETQDMLIHIRSSPPSRTPGARRGNMPVWYPSPKMQCIIKAESTKVEFPFLLQAEHDDDVLEMWDQPPSIPLEYLDKRGRLHRPMHTADYFVFRYRECGWIECKPAQELSRLMEKQPNRYVLDEQGIWRCPPGEAFATQYGLTYQVWSSDTINWAAQENALFLEDYSQDLDRLTVEDQTLALLYQLVEEHPGMLLSDLQAASEIPADLINIAIARHDLYVDLATYRLSEPWRTPVFRSQRLARASLPPSVQSNKDIPMPGDSATASSITLEGQTLLDQAREVDMVAAIFRNRVINPDHYHDDEQAQVMARAENIPARTKRRWRMFYREAESLYGSGLIGLLPQYAKCGRKREITVEVSHLVQQVLETHYDTVTRKPKRGAYGEYLRLSEEQHLSPVSQRMFYTEVQRHKTRYDQTLVREGARAAYPFKDYTRETERTMSRHGSYAWAMAHLDHTELNLVLCDSRTGQSLGKCWLTLLILSHPRRIAAYHLTFDPPSYRSCLAVLRLCVKRYGRLPTAITVDGGPEFASVYFEQLLALYRVRKHQRPAAEPRFGSPQERLFGTLETEVLYHLLGNTQATREPRLNTRATDPQRQAVWTLPALAERVQQWADEEYETIVHPALGMTPRDAYELSIKQNGARAHKHIPYDDAFLKATYPSTRKGTAKVEPGVGVRMNYLDYWCEAMRDPTVEGTQVQVRYDPFDVSIGFAYIDGKWRQCITPYTEFAGCSERELQLLTTELRQRNHLQYGKERIEVTQKQLATFRRENTDIEAILHQQRHDRETRGALVVLEGGKKSSTQPSTEPVQANEEKGKMERESPERDEEDRSLQKFACAQADRAMNDETNKALGQTEAPESFSPELLTLPAGARQEYFEQRCFISHPRLQEALEAILQAICPPGEGASIRRPGTMVLVIGPSRVGKTTLIRMLEECLLAKCKEWMISDPSFIPFASILAAGPGTNRFDWAEYYRSVLRALRDPFVDGKAARIRTRELREAMETALTQRKPLAVIVDEAHHLAEAARGSRLQSQLNHLKHFENAAGVSHILVGTYEMRPFRKVNAQLACRSIDVHFPRYDAANEEDAQIFRSILWALQRQLPVLEEPHLVEQWEFLYARSIGCIGLLKMHLNRALNLALTEQAKTVQLSHLRKTALSETRVELALRNALESEAELTESDGADERLLTLLGLRGSRPAPQSKTQTEEPSPKPKKQDRPGKRSPGRDAPGQESEEDPSKPLADKEKAG